MNSSRVVITGLGAVAPGAPDVAAFLQMLQQGRSGIRHVPELAELKFGCQVGGIAELPDMTAHKWFRYHEVDLASNFVQLAAVAGVEAWTSAGLPVPDPESEQVDWDSGAIIGTGIGGMDLVANKVVPLTASGRGRRIGGLVTQNIMPSGPAAHLAAILALGNQATANSSACCTGTEAMLEGYYRIRNGLARRMLVGGAEGFSPYFWAGFDALKALNSKSNDAPEAASRPMSASARGFVPASGAGVLLLEDLDSALARGAPIYGELLGGAMNCGGLRKGGTMTFPNYEGVARCIHDAFRLSGVAPAEVGLVSGHLTATKADPSEVAGWRDAFAKYGVAIPPINAPKSMFGHCLGAAGALESIAVVLQLRHGFLHPSINCEDLHLQIATTVGPEAVVREFRTAPELRIAVKASFGFGDVNSCVLLGKYSD